MSHWDTTEEPSGRLAALRARGVCTFPSDDHEQDTDVDVYDTHDGTAVLVDTLLVLAILLVVTLGPAVVTLAYRAAW